MPRYFFNIHDGVDLPDDEGTEFADCQEAQQGAISLAGNVIADAAKKIKLGENWTMEVSDASGCVIFKLDFHIFGTSTIGTVSST